MTQPITFNKYIASIYRQSKHDFNEQIAALDLRATTGDLLLFVADHPDSHNGKLPIKWYWTPVWSLVTYAP